MDLTGITQTLSDAPAFARLRDSLGGGRARMTASVADAARPCTIAALALGRESPVLVLTSKEHRADRLTEELTAWMGDTTPILPFPERDALPYERLDPAPETLRDRLQALAAFQVGRPAVVVACGLAVAQRTLSPAEVGGSIHRLHVAGELDPESFLCALLALGYQMEPVVLEPGHAGRRGGIIDLFPPPAEFPVRIELVGREIESLRLFDPATQRTIRALDEATIGPSREALGNNLDLKLLSGLDFRSCRPEVRERFDQELTLLRGGEVPQGTDFYVPFLARSTLLDHLRDDVLVIVDDETDISAALDEALDLAESSRAELEESGEIPRGLPPSLESWSRLRDMLDALPLTVRLSRWATEEEPGVIRLPFMPPLAYAGQLRKLVAELGSADTGDARTTVVSQQAQRLAELLAEEGTAVAVTNRVADVPGRLNLVQGSLTEGWRYSEDGVHLSLMTDTEVFGFVKQRRAPARKAINREAFLAELTPDTHVVHIDHGIARFAGLVRMTVDGNEREYLELHYAEGDRLFVPTDQLDRVSRYVGPSDRVPHPTRLGSGDWQRATARVKRAVAALAKDLIALYAAREVVPGHAFPPDNPWQTELEASFPYIETSDQAAAISAVKRDMQTPRPMDRLVCGDVGYGKTEVAIRAAFKAVMDGKQVAVLVPTTVLAQQHFETFSERLAAFPVAVDVLSRFRSDAEQRQIVERLADGAVDIIIGTHRLVQKDVSFKDLGLIVIDEEQRFGVAHKEYLKKMRREVDVLTLSATPIPRTLYMAMGGIRDMSTMETPPEERLPIKTYVSEFDDRLVREAISRELERGGQVYFVHNRVHNIEMIAEKVRDAVPEARVAIGHGQMDEKLLAHVMDDFAHGRIDVLVCTTIIESGLDIPNVNTIVINQADKLGLGQLYQLRGRVGRGAHRAYAYLLYDKRGRLTETAKQRLQTIFEATELGAGFQIALRDLEIRGAGNLLGSEQSGYMAAIGFDLYVRLLSGAVERMKALLRGEPPPPDREQPAVTIDIPISAHLPSAYVPDINVRLAVYQRLSAATDPREIAGIAQELVDRFGEPPPLVRNLLYVAVLRTLAQEAGIQSIAADDGVAVLRARHEEPLPRETLEGTVPRGVTVGRSLIRVELGDGWRERLRRTLEQVAAVSGTGEQPEV